MYYKFARKEKGSETLTLQQLNICLSRAARDLHLAPKKPGLRLFTVCCSLIGCADTGQLRRQPTSNTHVLCQKESVLFEIIFMSF